MGKRGSFPSAAQFARALSQIAVPGGRQTEFLRAHREAPSRTSTATLLAQAAGYANWRAINLCYGTLAKKVRLSLCLGPTGEKAELELIVEIHRTEATNAHWKLTMRPEFAEALKLAGWV